MLWRGELSGADGKLSYVPGTGGVEVSPELMSLVCEQGKMILNEVE
jgi:hypothetical protein